jgi:hypothetical protein
MHRRAFLLSLLAVALTFSHASAQDKKAAAGNPHKDKYQNAQVAAFDAQEGVKITPEQLKALTDTVVKELQDMKKFKQVAREGETPSDAAAPTLKIAGTITKFKEGSRAKRYLVGFGAGKSKVIAHVKFIDAATGQVLYEFNADGDVVMGLFGGNSGGAKSELAEQIAKAAKKNF